GVQNRLPLLEPVVVHGLEVLHVQRTAAYLDRGVALPREQVQLTAFLHPLDGKACETVLSGPEGASEGAPLPARNHSPPRLSEGLRSCAFTAEGRHLSLRGSSAPGLGGGVDDVVVGRGVSEGCRWIGETRAGGACRADLGVAAAVRSRAIDGVAGREA